MSQRVEVVWPDELVARIDAARGDVPRTKWIQRACESALAPVEKEPPRVARALETREAVREHRAKKTPSVRDTWAR